MAEAAEAGLHHEERTEDMVNRGGSKWKKKKKKSRVVRF